MISEKIRQDGMLADYCKAHPDYAGVRLSMLLFGDKWDRAQARKSMLREVPNLLRNYSGERGEAPFSNPDVPAWLFPCTVKGERFVSWHKPDGSQYFAIDYRGK